MSRTRRGLTVLVSIATIAMLLAGSSPGLGAEEEEGGNNLSTPVIFAEGYGLSGFQVDETDVTSTGLPGLLKSSCSGAESWVAGSNHVEFPVAGSAYQLQIDGTVFDEQEGTSTAAPGDYFLQPYSLVPLAGGTPVDFGAEICWEADWADGSSIDTVEVNSLDVGDDLVRVLRSVGSSPIRVEFTLFQTTDTPGTFQEGLDLSGYPMTGLWPPSFVDGKPPSVGGGDRLEVWATPDVSGSGQLVPAEAATVFTQNARLTVDKLAWSMIPDSFADGDLEGYPSGVIPDTFSEGYQDWVESVEYDGVVGGSEGESGFSAETNQGGRVLYGYNWGAAAAGWYRITLSIDGIANGVAANASITGVNPDDQLADESEGGSGGSSKGFFPPTFVEDSDGNYVYLDVYVAPKPAALPGHINGKLVNAASSPLGSKTVTVYRQDGTPAGLTDTGSDGLFGTSLLPGTYNLGFDDPAGVYYPEFYDDRVTLEQADDLAVATGQTTYVEATLSTVAPPGSGRIKGLVRNDLGDGLKDVAVTVYSSAGDPVAETVTDADGNYAVVLLAGTYRVGFSDPAGVYADEYYNNKVSVATANDVIVVDGTAVNVSATLAKAGQIKGTVRGEFLGDPLEGATVTATDQAGTAIKAVKTDANGAFLLALPAGTYKIRTTAPGHLTEWYDNQSSVVAADALTVAPADVFTIDVRLFPADFFVDVDPSSVFVGDIQWLQDSGITKGCNPPANDRFCPDEAVTRAQMASFLVRALGLTEGGDLNRFVDDDGSVHEADIDRLAAAGITKGCNPPTNDRFCPSSDVLREQMAAFLHRAFG
ncbi:MAG: carboxypeptidase regulatory-like domain-containing protein [Acidimicrobiia bacterium]